jgi:hypothetical protein
MTMYAPVFRGTATQRTEIRVAYDDEYFYAAAGSMTTTASSIRVNSLYRDRWNGDDAFAIYIDAFNDKKNAKWFGTTPGGIRFDQLVSDDGATLNGDWDTFWSAATTITNAGWFAEVRIPVLEPRLPCRRQRSSDHGTHRDAPRLAQRRARHVSGDRPAVRVSTAIGGARGDAP